MFAHVHTGHESTHTLTRTYPYQHLEGHRQSTTCKSLWIINAYVIHFCISSSLCSPIWKTVLGVECSCVTAESAMKEPALSPAPTRGLQILFRGRRWGMNPNGPTESDSRGMGQWAGEAQTRACGLLFAFSHRLPRVLSRGQATP